MSEAGLTFQFVRFTVAIAAAVLLIAAGIA